MDSHLSESSSSLARLRESMAHSDWTQVESIACGIRLHTIPPTVEALGEYLADLKLTLVAIKVCRANLKASRVRLNAAANFGAAEIEFSPRRQNSAVSTGF